jgi:hypothetical protein
MKIVGFQHLLKLAEFCLMDCLDQVLLVFGIVKEAATLPRTAKLNETLIVVEPD